MFGDMQCVCHVLFDDTITKTQSYVMAHILSTRPAVKSHVISAQCLVTYNHRISMNLGRK